MARMSYVPVGEAGADQHTSSADSPQIPQQSASGGTDEAPTSPRSAMPASPRLNQSAGYFSSAGQYAPVGSGEQHLAPSTPRTPSMGQLRSSDDPLSRPGSALPWTPGLAGDHHSIRHSLMSYNSFRGDGAVDSEYMPSHDSGAILLKHRDAEVETPGEKAGPDAKTEEAPLNERYANVAGKSARNPRRKWFIFAGVVLALILIAIAIAVPLVAIHDAEHSDSVNSGSGRGGGGGSTDDENDRERREPPTGRDGSIITMENGTTFRYRNQFGGQWHSALVDNGARAQNYSPPLNETWDYARDRMLGVNLGGWLVIEPFIVPGLFEPYENNSATTVVDEYTLLEQWRSEFGDDGARERLIEHYDTFITEKDFADIAGAGLNWIRLPIGYWAVSTEPGDGAFFGGLAWPYVIKAVGWARKYGLRINLDLHSIAGSQNGYNHGGRLGVFNFLNSPMGLVSAQRTLETIRVLAEFVSLPDVRNVVPMFGILNEPNVPTGIGMENMRRWYAEVYRVVREVSGTGAGNGPYISFHDGFMGLSSWSGFMQGGDRIAWDLHPYVGFTPPFGDRAGLVTTACNQFMANEDNGLQNFGLTTAGEWSLATNDCGLYLNGPHQGVRYDGSWAGGQFERQGDCAEYDNWWEYSPATKIAIRQTAQAQMQAFHNFFFWTWKIGGSERLGGRPPNPMWSYSLGLQEGWMPTDPRAESANACAQLQQSGVGRISKTSLDWGGSFADYQVGRASSYSPALNGATWPPTSMRNRGSSDSLDASALPVYRQNGSPIRLPTPTFRVEHNEPTPLLVPQNNARAYAAVDGCTYPESIWANSTSVPSGWPCSAASGGSRKRSMDFGYPNFADGSAFA